MTELERQAQEPEVKMTSEEMLHVYPESQVKAAMFARNYKMWGLPRSGLVIWLTFLLARRRQQQIENYQKHIEEGVNVEILRRSMEEVDLTEPQDLDEDVKWRMRIIKAADPKLVSEDERVNREAVLQAYRQKKLKVDGQITLWFAGKIMMGPFPNTRKPSLSYSIHNMTEKWSREYGAGNIWVEKAG
ncbi:hypothetical protein F5884DRAFT_826601 [Xylogone sp. PMI_703]|nr:hypothetical protein F5884DRAFT_826601 [Xylogone sp. PMI_703]